MDKHIFEEKKSKKRFFIYLLWTNGSYFIWADLEIETQPKKETVICFISKFDSMQFQLNLADVESIVVHVQEKKVTLIRKSTRK